VPFDDVAGLGWLEYGIEDPLPEASLLVDGLHPGFHGGALLGVLLTDLDRKECAPTLIGEWLGRQAKPEGLLFRVAVREVEAWLLADKQNFASFARVPLAKLPEAPEDLDDPKQTLLNLVTRYSPASLKKDLVADHGHGPRQGLVYNERLSQFVRACWDLEEASMRADSLARTRRRIGELAAQCGEPA